MKSATPTTELDGYVKSPPLSTTAILKIQVYIALMFRTAMICLFAMLRIQPTYEDGNPSVLDNNRVFKSIGTVSLYAVSVIAGILWCVDVGLQRYMKDIHYRILKFVGSFSAFLAPFSYMMVLVLPLKFNWIAYLATCVTFGIFITCFCLDEQQESKRSPTFDYSAICLVLILIVLALCLPDNLNWIAFPLIYLSLGMEIAYHLVTYLIFITQKTRKPCSLEAQLIQQDDHNRHLGMNYLQVLGRN